MPKRPVITDDVIGQRLWADTKAQVLGMAKLAGPGKDQTPLTPEDELLLWMTVADGWTPEQEMQMLLDGKSREDVGLAKYSHRKRMIEQGDRFFDKYAQARYAARMAQKSDPTWAPQPPPGALPTGQQTAVSTLSPSSESRAGTSASPLPFGG